MASNQRDRSLHRLRSFLAGMTLQTPTVSTAPDQQAVAITGSESAELQRQVVFLKQQLSARSTFVDHSVMKGNDWGVVTFNDATVTVQRPVTVESVIKEVAK